MRQSRAFVAQRRGHIAELLRQKGRVSVTDLADQLDISPLTVRRDLDYLEHLGIAVRKYGEAVLNEPTVGEQGKQPPRRLMAKHAIARAAADLVEDSETLFINTGSTALLTAEKVRAKNVTVITNSTRVQTLDTPPTMTVLVTGGEIRAPRGTLCGEFALNNIRNASASTCLAGCAGISVETGVTSNTPQEATINSLMARRSGRLLILAGSDKIGFDAGFTYGQPSDIDLLITDTDASPESLAKLHEGGLRKILLVDPNSGAVSTFEE